MIKILLTITLLMTIPLLILTMIWLLYTETSDIREEWYAERKSRKIIDKTYIDYKAYADGSNITFYIPNDLSPEQRTLYIRKCLSISTGACTFKEER